MPEKMVLGLGGNVGDVPQTFRAVVERLRSHLALEGLVISPVFVTTPVGPVRDQPPFLNCCVAANLVVLGDGSDPVGLLRQLQSIEHELGRRRGQEPPGGPRPIDIDLLLLGDLVARFAGPPELVLPHPRLHERLFVLVPLLSLLGPELVIPGPNGGPLKALADAARAAHPDHRVRLW